MKLEIPLFEYQKGDHWTQAIINTFEFFKEHCKGNLEFHALVGVVKGIRDGTITKGSRTYAKIALAARVDGEYDYLANSINDLGHMGLFTPHTIGGRFAENLPERMVTTKNDDYESESIWTSIAENIYSINDPVTRPEICVLLGILRSVENKIVTVGDSYYLELAQKGLVIENGERTNFSMEQLGQSGLFGDELLFGCQPERATAVSRLK